MNYKALLLLVGNLWIGTLLCAQKPAPTTMDLLQNKYWVYKEAFRIGSLVYEQYDQREQCSTFFSKQEELSGCRDYYLSDTIVRSYQEDSVGMENILWKEEDGTRMSLK